MSWLLKVLLARFYWSRRRFRWDIDQSYVSTVPKSQSTLAAMRENGLGGILGRVEARLLILCAHDSVDHPDWKKALGRLDSGRD